MNNIDWRVLRLEQGAIADEQAIAKLQQTVAQLQQQQWTPSAGGQGGESSGGAYVCMCPTAVSGTWSGSTPTTPGSFTAVVYQLSGGTYTAVAGGSAVTVYNAMISATIASRGCNLNSDGAGNYVVLSQSCT
jgi:hypothetical protein